MKLVASSAQKQEIDKKKQSLTMSTTTTTQVQAETAPVKLTLAYDDKIHNHVCHRHITRCISKERY